MLLVLMACLLSAPVGTGVRASESAGGMIVDYGDGNLSWVWVPFTEDEIPLLEFMQRSGLDVVTVQFGGLGQAVCQIDATGCPVGECRKRLCQTSSADSPFWQLWVYGDGAWHRSGRGASGSVVTNGSIYGWAWRGTEPAFPSVTMDEIARNAGADPSADAPVAALRREGEPPSANDGQSPLVVAGAIGLVGLAVVALVARSRLAQRRPA